MRENGTNCCRGRAGSRRDYLEKKMRRALLDRRDFEFMRDMYLWAPCMGEFTGGVKGTGIEERIYRLSRLGLCACDRPGMHPGEPLCWSLSPEGEMAVEMADADREFHLPRRYPNWCFHLGRLDGK